MKPWGLAGWLPKGKIPLWCEEQQSRWGGRAVCSAGGCRGCWAAVCFAPCPAEPGGCNQLLRVQARCRETWSWASLLSSQRPEFNSHFFPGNSTAPGDLAFSPTGWSVEYSARCWTKFSPQQHQVLATAAGSRQGQLAAVQASCKSADVALTWELLPGPCLQKARQARELSLCSVIYWQPQLSRLLFGGGRDPLRRCHNCTSQGESDSPNSHHPGVSPPPADDLSQEMASVQPWWDHVPTGAARGAGAPQAVVSLAGDQVLLGRRTPEMVRERWYRFLWVETQFSPREHECSYGHWKTPNKTPSVYWLFYEENDNVYLKLANSLPTTHSFISGVFYL